MARDWRFEVGRARATARIGFDYLRSLLLPVTVTTAREHASYPRPSLTIRTAASRHSLPQRVRLLGWNIHRAYAGAQVAAGLHALVTERAPHVLLLQEVPVYPDRPWWLTGGLRDLLADYHLLFAPMHRVRCPTAYYPFRESGVVVAVRGGFDDPTGVQLPAVSRPKLGSGHIVERVAVGVRCLIGGTPVWIWNVHLENTARPSGRAHQARAAAASIGDGPVILGGDFNTMFRPLEGVDRVMQDFGFSRPRLSGQSWLVPQLDYFFVRGLRALRAARLPIRGSDHRPIYGEFVLES